MMSYTCRLINKRNKKMECPRIPHNDITPVINKAANRRLNAIFKHFTGSNE